MRYAISVNYNSVMCTKWCDLFKWKKCLEIYSKHYQRRIHDWHIQRWASNTCTSGPMTRKGLESWRLLLASEEQTIC